MDALLAAVVSAAVFHRRLAVLAPLLDLTADRILVHEGGPLALRDVWKLLAKTAGDFSVLRRLLLVVEHNRAGALSLLATHLHTVAVTDAFLVVVGWMSVVSTLE